MKLNKTPIRVFCFLHLDVYNMTMTEQDIILDFDNSVGTEDRFAIRRFMNLFIETVNNGTREELEELLSDSITADGFSEFTLQKSQISEMFYKKFYGRRHNYINMPKLKLTSSKFFFHLNGSYEEYQEGILSAAGSLDLSVARQNEKFCVVSLKFYPRMRLSDDV